MLTSFLTSEIPDPLLAIARAAALDERAEKLDLTLGVYRNDRGQTPVMQAVREAELQLAESQLTKAYLGVDGNAGFVADVFGLLGLSGTAQDGWAGLQTPGGTGALRLAAELLARGNAGRTAWLPTPSWTNHAHVLQSGGLAVRSFEAYRPVENRADAEAMMAAARQAKAGDLFVLQPICHNPTGADLSLAEKAALADLLAQRGVIVLLDIAYHGFAEGIEAERAHLEIFTERLSEVLIAYSCSKNFSLYRERAGALLLRGRDQAARDLAFGAAAALARGNYSMPPDHGAAVVTRVLNDAGLRGLWREELAGMAARLGTVRSQLASLGHVGGLDMAQLARSRGMFCQLALPASVIRALREDHAIYMEGKGRINLAALPPQRITYFASCLAEAAGAVMV